MAGSPFILERGEQIACPPSQIGPAPASCGVCGGGQSPQIQDEDVDPAKAKARNEALKKLGAPDRCEILDRDPADDRRTHRYGRDRTDDGG